MYDKTGEGNGNPFQYSCMENPMDGGAWWAAVYGVAQSLTRLKWLSSSSSADWREREGENQKIFLRTIKQGPEQMERIAESPGKVLRPGGHCDTGICDVYKLLTCEKWG